MKLITDLHIHSHFSLATSKQLTPEYLDLWGRMKGVQVIATGDFTHPGWTKELQEKIEPTEKGLFRLKDEYCIDPPIKRFKSHDYFTRFILSAEISSIYKKNGKVRKVHSVILAPDFETVEKIQQSLINIGGNITSDGRPILGLDAKNLLEICLEASEDIFFIPAHIWTPWFSVLGAKSGFDSIEECFEDLSHHIHAVETGLSTNAPMNWMCSFLDKYTLLSNSDAHSPEKLGRNANIMDCELSYDGIIRTMKNDDKDKFLGTIDMYPQEGKYHYDGHRKCGVVYNPVETLENNGICSKCGRKITVGVMNRIVQLSDRENLEERPNRLPFHSIIPLKEILSEISGVGPNTKTVAKKYNEVLTDLGCELDILLNIPIDEIKSKSGMILSEAINRMRNNKVIIKEGYDGEFGIIKTFTNNELTHDRKSPKLFPDKISKKEVIYKSQNLLNFSLERYRELQKTHFVIDTVKQECKTLSQLSVEQIAAVEYMDNTCLVMAGPGTGKTKTLVSRIAYLIEEKNVKSENILAVTFTNKSADEIRERVANSISNKKNISLIHILTFHNLGLKIIKENLKEIGIAENFTIIDDKEQSYILKKNQNIEVKQVKSILKKISLYKQNNDSLDREDQKIFADYQHYLQKNNLLDIDDLVYQAVKILQNNNKIQIKYKSLFHQILIDEYQDINESQFQLIQMIFSKTNLFAIGDSNQAIYGFRGANVKYINNFIDYFHNARIINFTKSYRCSNQILEASANVINENETLKGLQKGVKLRVHQAETEKGEAEFIARKIEEITGGMRFFSIDSNVTDGHDENNDAGLDDIVVLCRTKLIMQPIVHAFNNHAIPYEIVDNKPFYKEKPIVEILDVFKTILNPNYIMAKEVGLDFVQLNSIDKTGSTKDILSEIINQFFQKEITSNKKEIQRLLNFAENFDNHEIFLQKLVLGFSEDFYSITTHNVKIMTLHASKGLEFQHVFITGCENKLLPFSVYKNFQSDYDEEKRLFYVGMTRSKKYLYLTNAKNRNIRGQNFSFLPSPFLEKIKKELLKIERNKYKNKVVKEDRQLDLF